MVEYVPVILEPSLLRVPVNEKVWEPADAVRFSVWALRVPVTTAEPAHVAEEGCEIVIE